MDAFFARNRLSAYIDGELSQAEAREVEAALSRDATLKAEYDSLRYAIDLLQGEGLVEAPRGFAEAVRARTDREPMPLGWRRWVRQIRLEPVLLAAAALLVVAYVGHRKDLPELAPPNEGIASAGAFAKDLDEPDLAAAAGASPEAAGPGVNPEEPRQEVVASANSLDNDGVLGNEVKPAAKASKESYDPKQQSMAPQKSSGKKQALEVEQWQPEWEVDSPANTASAGNSASGNTAGGSGSANTGEVQFFSPAPFRYRVVANDEKGLKQLEAIAKELGGELQDSRGGRVAAWMLEEGDSRKLRVVVPGYNASALAQRLREIGTVETIKENETLVKDANSAVPVQVDVSF